MCSTPFSLPVDKQAVQESIRKFADFKRNRWYAEVAKVSQNKQVDRQFDTNGSSAPLPRSFYSRAIDIQANNVHQPENSLIPSLQMPTTSYAESSHKMISIFQLSSSSENIDSLQSSTSESG